MHQARNGPANKKVTVKIELQCFGLQFWGRYIPLRRVLFAELLQTRLVRQENVSRTVLSNGTVLFTHAVKYCNQIHIRKDTLILRIPICYVQMCVTRAEVKTMV